MELAQLALSGAGWLLVLASIGLLMAGAGTRIEHRLASAWQNYLRWVDNIRDRFYLDTRVEHIAALMLGAGVAVGALWGWLSGSTIDALLATAAALAAPAFIVRALWNQRINAVRQQIEIALTLMASRWRTSADVGRSFEAIVEHLDPPIAQEAELVVRELRIGTPIDEVLHALEARLPIRPVQLMCVGIRQALPLGANVAEVLDQIGAAVRESNRLEMFVDSKTTEGRTQAFVMGAMPFLAAYGLYRLDPTIIQPLLERTVGNVILGAALLLDLLGLFLILKITDIKV